MKPYPEYKASGIDWLGEIPSHWKAYKLKYFIEISNGCDPKTDGDVPVYGTGEKPFKTCGESKPGPTVLLGRKGSIDTPHWVQEDYWNVDTAFDTKAKSGYLLRFFWYVANCLDYSKFSANTAVPSMTQSAYENMSIPVPTVEEQEAIAGYLDEVTGKIDALISEKTAQVEELRAYRSSLITETVTHGLNSDVPLRDSGIDWLGSIPQNWEVCKLAWLADVQTGTTPSTSESKYWDDPTELWFTPGDFQGMELKDSSRKVSKTAYLKNVCRRFPPFTVYLVGIGATLGKIAYCKTESSANQQINAIIFNDRIYPIYGAYFLTGISNVIKSSSNAATLPILNQEQTKKLQVTVPPLSEQKEIADFLDKKTAKIDRLIEELTKQLDELAEYKQAVITEAVTGKVDVRDYNMNT